MQIGAGLVIKTVRAIEEGRIITQSQEELMAEGEELNTAPKIYKEDCRIDWNESGETIKNLIRGLSPYPGAFTEIPLENGNMMLIKVYKVAISHCDCASVPGAIITDGKSFFKICCKDACVELLELQQAGKKRMKVTEFLAGLNTNVLKKSL
jgi:methionyl-tRNA formyltransferase